MALKIKKLEWEQHGGTYPSWTTSEPCIGFTAEIDTSRALMYGKFPLFIDGHPSPEKPNTLKTAQRIAQKVFEEDAREAIERLTNISAYPPHQEERDVRLTENQLWALRTIDTAGVAKSIDYGRGFTGTARSLVARNLVSERPAKAGYEFATTERGRLLLAGA